MEVILNHRISIIFGIINKAVYNKIAFLLFVLIIIVSYKAKSIVLDSNQIQEIVNQEEVKLDTLEYLSLPEEIFAEDTDLGVLVSGGVRVSNIKNYAENTDNLVGYGVFDFGVIFDKTYYIGISVNNLSFAKIESNYLDNNYKTRPLLAIEYYGIELGSVIYTNDNWKIHLNSIFSSGLIEYRIQSTLINTSIDPLNVINYGKDDFILIEPELAISYNPTNWARVLIGTSYRLPVSLNYTYQTETYNNNNLTGFTTFIKLQFGDLWL